MEVFPLASDHRLPRVVSRFLNFPEPFFAARHVFHSSYHRVSKASNSLNVTTVHDLIYEKFGRGVGAVANTHQKVNALKASRCIVCVSESTKRDLLTFYPWCEGKRILVIPNGVDGFRPVAFEEEQFARFGIERPNSYFLYVGHRGPCKGFDQVFDVLDRVTDLKCIVVGGSFSSTEVQRIADRGHNSSILNLGRVSDEDLNALYSNARFFFFPSLYEGFGIPPLEAMQAGCPVLASNSSSIPEIVSNAGILFEPNSIGSLDCALSQILAPETSARLRNLGRDRSASFSWNRMVTAYDRLYAEILNSQ